MGWGQVGQHRKHGEKGDRKVGRHKHLWTYTIKYEPNYFGRRGFKTPQSIKGQNHPNTINIQQLDELIDKLTRQKQLTKKQGKPYIDLTAHGYQKLLATGQTTKPIIIKVDSYSENAHKKIQEAGGQILGTPLEETQPETQEEASEEVKENVEEQPKG